jgi:flagellar assembly factor FliW
MTEALIMPEELRIPMAAAPATLTQITLARPLLGFPGSSSFCLHELGDGFAPFMALTSLDEAGLYFVVVPPGLLFPDYVLEIPEDDVALLGLEAPEDVAVFVLVTRASGGSPTANLLGPLVVNRLTGVGTQVVLQDGRYGAAVPLSAGRATL